MEEKKYELRPSDREGLFRILALKSFSNIKKGDVGGYVSGEYNLSHEGNCWIGDNAVVCDNAYVSGNAVVGDKAYVYDNANVYGNALVFDNTEVYNEAMVGGNTFITCHAKVFGNIKVIGNIFINGHASVSGGISIGENACITGNAIINDNSDYLVFKNTWSSGRYFTWTRSNNMWKVGCFYGTGEELIKKAYQDSKLSGEMYELYVNLVKEILKKEKELK